METFDWSNTYLTSDLHIFHKNILKYCPNRKFDTVEEMNEGIITAWNNKVPNGATVFLLGDFAFCSLHKQKEIAERLNGNIHIIRGNHDAKFPDDVFVSISNYREIKVGNQEITICHFPFLVWNRSHRGSWNLHGHSHNTLPYDKHSLRMDVGIDSHPKLEPFSMNEIAEYMNKKEWKALDHHDKDTK
jgi:calcineurin-like phosphoesterase family protein